MLEAHHHELARLEREYWWFQVRFRLVEDTLVASDLLSPQTRLVDWGCGTGGFLEHVLRRGLLTRQQICGVEPAEQAQRVLGERDIPFVPPSPIESLEGTAAARPSVITMLDVLEHIEDGISTLRDLRRLAAPGASLILTVPAFDCLWSDWDVVLGHKRRYTRRTLHAALRAAAWQPVRTRYVFSSMIIPALFRSTFLRASISRSEFPRLPSGLNRLLIAWYRLEWVLAPVPFGTSILCLARRSE